MKEMTTQDYMTLRWDELTRIARGRNFPSAFWYEYEELLDRNIRPNTISNWRLRLLIKKYLKSESPT